MVFLFLILYPAPAPDRSAPPSLSHTTLTRTQLCHTPSFTDNFVTPHLSHTLFHTQLCHTHTPSFTHTHQLCHTPTFTCHACHAKRRWMSPSATPATQSGPAPRATQRAQVRHQSQPSAPSATPATQNEGRCH